MSGILIGEAIQRVQSMYSKGVQSKDTRLTSRHIYNALLTGRSTILPQVLNKKQSLSDFNYQTLPCVELQKASVHECACIPVQGCVILRSKYQIPDIISGMDDLAIKYVTSIDGSITFTSDSFETTKYSVGNKYTSKKPSYFFRDEYLYITVLKSLRAVTVNALFHDVIAAETFKSICEDCPDCEDCRDYHDLPFPIDGRFLKPILDIANNELIILFKQMTEDDSNNASDDIAKSMGGTMIHQPDQQQ